MDKVKEKRSSDINHSNISLGTPAEVYHHLLDPGWPGAAQSRDQDHTLAILCSYGCFFLECGCHLFPSRRPFSACQVGSFSVWKVLLASAMSAASSLDVALWS
ncbi:unnamed protein product [Boreogadus saida]